MHVPTSWALQHPYAHEDAGARSYASRLMVLQCSLVAMWSPAAESHQRHVECNLFHNIACLLCSASSAAVFSEICFQVALYEPSAFYFAVCKYGPQLARPEDLVKRRCNNTNSVGETDADRLCCCRFPYPSTDVQQRLGTPHTSWT